MTGPLDRCWWPADQDVRPGRIVPVQHLRQISDKDWQRLADRDRRADRPPGWLVQFVKNLFKERNG